MATQPRNTLHNFIMREAASTGGLKHKPTFAQLGYLKTVAKGDVNVCRGYLNGAPSGVNMRTHGICERASWVKTAPGPFDQEKAVTITDAGRAALTASEEKGS